MDVIGLRVSPGRQWLLASLGVVLVSTGIARASGSLTVGNLAADLAVNAVLYALLLTLRRWIWRVVVAAAVLGELLLVRAAQLHSWETWRVVTALLGAASTLMLFVPAVRRELH